MLKYTQREGIEVEFNVNEVLNQIIHDKKIKRIINKVSDPHYSQLSFQEKKNIYKEFNNILNSFLFSDLGFHINKNAEKGANGDVKLSNDNELIIVEGFSGNPYIYLKDILIQHLYKIEHEDSINTQIGDVGFEEDYSSSGFKFVYYNKDNIWMIKKATQVIDSLLKNIDNDYKREYEKDFDKVITKEAEDEINICYELFDKEIKLDSYDALVQIGDTIDQELFNAFSPSKNNLALLSLTPVLSSLQIQASLDKEEEKKADMLLKKFIKEFFNEYSDDINIEMRKSEVYVNGTRVKENQMFIDVLLQAIDDIEKKNPRINDLISDETLKKALSKINNCSKLDLYFIRKLDKLDVCLKDRNLELIDYVPWAQIYKSSNKKVFKDKKDIFDRLLEREDFISEVSNYLNGSFKTEKSCLNKIFSMLNEAYFNSDFKLEFGDNVTGDTFLGDAGEKKVCINVVNSDSKEGILATLFHEYRHLVQEEESKNNRGVFSDTIYPLIQYNNKFSVFDLGYSYCEDIDYGYANSFHYFMQPTEYDAETFSYNLLKKIAAKLHKHINYSRCFPSLVRTKFIDQEKISLLSYEDYLKRNHVNESYLEDEMHYKELMEMYDNMNSKEDAIKVFTYKRFSHMKIKDKVKVYQYLSNKKIGYNEKTMTLHIGKKAINIVGMTDYDVLEKLLYDDALELVSENKLKRSEINTYIYQESKKYKQNKFDIYNFLTPYYYHKCFDKYSKRREKKKEIVKTK